MDPNQQQTLTLRTYSFSSSQTGDWYYQFGLWKDQAGGTLLHRAPSPAEVLTVSQPTTVGGQITGYQVSPNPAGVGDSVSFRVTVKNTGNTRHTFVAGLSVWKVGSSISTSIIDTNQQVTLDPNQQQTVTLRTYSFSSSQTGDWNYQFGLWRDQAGGTLLDREPSPAGVLTVTSPPQPVTGQITGYNVSPNPAGVGDPVSFRVTVKNTGTVSHTFVAGLSVWKVGSSISTSIIDTNQQVTLDPSQQQTLTLRTYSFSSSQTGDWNYQFGLWKDQAGGTLLHKEPSPAGVLTVAKFRVGDRVRVTTNLNVRTGPSTSHPEITDPDYPGYAPAGSLGTVVDGPISADGYVWWKSQYDLGFTGWSVENGLERI